MPAFCKVIGCNKFKRKAGINKNSFHAFPLSDSKLMEKWIEKIDVKNVSIHSKICDIHFDARCIRIDTDHKKKLLPGVIPLEFKENGRKIINIGSSKIDFAKKENNVSEEQAVPKSRKKTTCKQNASGPCPENHEEINCFGEFIDQFENRMTESRKQDWNFWKQIDGIHFYRVAKDGSFPRLKIPFQIFIDKEMRVFFHKTYEKAGFDELDWILDNPKLTFWRQFEIILDHYQSDTVLQIDASPRFHLKQAIESLSQVESSQNVEMIKSIIEQVQTMLNEIDPFLDIVCPKIEPVDPPIEETANMPHLHIKVEEPDEAESQKVTDDLKYESNEVCNNEVKTEESDDLLKEMECSDKQPPARELDIRSKKKTTRVRHKNACYPRRSRRRFNIECDRCSIVYRSVHAFKRHFFQDHLNINLIESRQGIVKREDDDNESTDVFKALNFELHDETRVQQEDLFFPESVRKSKGFKCDRCGLVLRSRLGFEKHFFEKHLGIARRRVKTSKGKPRRDVLQKGICEHCGKEFETQLTMRNHFYSKHFNPTQCEICGKKFNTIKGYKAHSVRHQDIKKVKCSKCDVMMLPESLRRHMKTSHLKIKPFKCNHCDKGFPKPYLLRAHEKLHENNNPDNTCPVCNIKLKLGGKVLEKHISKCSLGPGLKFKKLQLRYPCKECSRSFTTKIGCAEHLKRLHGIVVENLEKFCFECMVEVEEPFVHAMEHNCQFKCDQCPRKFNSQEKLDNHMKRCCADRPFSCDLCGSRFKNKNHMTSHTVSVHTEKKFKCQVCDKKYAAQYMLNSHFSQSHSTEKKYPCKFCDLKFVTVKRWKRHCLNVHGEDKMYKCDSCEAKFSTLNELKRHSDVEHGKSMNPQRYHQI